MSVYVIQNLKVHCVYIWQTLILYCYIINIVNITNPEGISSSKLHSASLNSTST